MFIVFQIKGFNGKPLYCVRLRSSNLLTLPDRKHCGGIDVDVSFSYFNSEPKVTFFWATRSNAIFICINVTWPGTLKGRDMLLLVRPSSTSIRIAPSHFNLNPKQGEFHKLNLSDSYIHIHIT